MAAQKKKKRPPPKKVVAKKKPVKKAPAKKRKAPPKKNKREPVYIEREPIVAGLDTIPDELDRGFLRDYAKLYYATSINQCSVTDMLDHPIIGVVPIRTLKRWKQEDQWVEERRRSQEVIRGKVEEEIGTALARTRIEELHQILDVKQKLIDKLMGENPPAFTSYEACVGVMIKLIDLADRHREKIGEILVPQTFDAEQATSTLPVRAKMDDKAVRALARMATKMYRERRLQGRQGGEEVD